MNPKTRATICCLQVTCLKYKDTDRLKGIGKMYYANINQKKDGRNILISGEANFRGRKVIRDQEEHYIRIKGLIFQEEIAILNVHESKN